MSNIEKHNAQGIQVQTLGEAMRYAEAMSGAGMIPEKFKGQPANVLVAQEIAHTLEESTWMVMSELYFVGSVPTFSAKFMRSRIRQAGHKLREYFDKETMTARAVIIRHDDPEHEHVAEWDMQKAKDHGLGSKNHWKKNPELMLKNRALSEVMREACYEVMGGIAYTSDEAQDFVRMDSQRMDQQAPQQAPQDAPQGQPQQQAPQGAAERLAGALGARPVDGDPVEVWAARIAEAGTVDELMDMYRAASTNPAWSSEIKPMFSERRAQIEQPQEQPVDQVVEAEPIDPVIPIEGDWVETPAQTSVDA